MRIDLLDRMMRQDGVFHQSHPPGFLIQRVQSDVNAVGDVRRAVITGADKSTIFNVVTRLIDPQAMLEAAHVADFLPNLEHGLDTRAGFHADRPYPGDSDNGWSLRGR